MDETGAPYVDPSLPPVVAGPVTGMQGTHMSKFAFCAYLAGVWANPPALFIVNEEGVVYRSDEPGPRPITTWPSNRPSKPWRAAD